MEAFNMPNLDCTLRNEHNQYTSDHYKVYFIRGKQFQELSHTIKKAQYLTYKGILRVLFASNSGSAEKFQDWAEEILFTHQMGTKEAKEGLSAKLSGIDLKTFKAVFDTYATTFPCIYLMHLGIVKDVRETFGIDASVADDLIVYKYGFTDNLGRRFKEHSGTYGKMPGVTLRLITFHMVDTKYTSDAEGDVRGLMKFRHANLVVDKYKELVVMSSDDLAYVKKEYINIGSRYAGATAGLTATINDLEKQLVEEKHKNHILQMELDRKSAEMSKAEYIHRLEIQILQQGGKLLDHK
jgi:hypothetical protein